MVTSTITPRPPLAGRNTYAGICLPEEGPEPPQVDKSTDFADVSAHQGDVDWDKYAKAGFQLAICKATEGPDWTDDFTSQNRQELSRNNLYCGLYHFAGSTIAHKISDPRVEARYYLEKVGPMGPKEFPVLDFELPYGMSPAQQSDWIGKWCTEVEQKTGKTPWVYTNQSILRKLDGEALGHFPLWLAAYSETSPPPPAPWPTLTAWQYTYRARIPGVQGGCDASHLYGDMSKLVPPPGGSSGPAPAPAPEPAPAPGPTDPSPPPAPAPQDPSPAPTIPSAPAPSTPPPSSGEGFALQPWARSFQAVAAR